MILYYLANARIPTEKAHGIAIMKMCEAFAREGAEVQLLLPRRVNPIKEDPFAYYGAERIFNIKKLPIIDIMPWLDKLGFFLGAITYAASASVYCMMKRADVYYGRDEMALGLISLFRRNVMWEAHTAKKKWLVQGLLRRCKLLVVISGGLKDYYATLGVPKEKILVAPSGVDVDQFSITVSKDEARRTLSLPQDKRIALYTGHLYAWKGADTLAQAAEHLEEDTIAVFVGGTESDIAAFRRTHKNNPRIMLMGQRPHREIPLFLKAADVLVLPNSAQAEISRSHTSPMKLFEYMASGTPIVASDVSSIREILSEDNSFLFSADDSQACAQAIHRALEDKELAQSRTQEAGEQVRVYTWEKRAEMIITYMKSHGTHAI